MLLVHIIDKRNLEDSNIYDESKGSRVGSTGLKSIPLAKIEMVVPNKDARKVVEMISTNSGLSATHGGKSLFLKWKRLLIWKQMMLHKILNLS